AMMGTGEGEGENRALEAAERAIANPLLDGVSMQGAKGVIISIIGGEDMKLLEVDEAANHIRELVDEDANIIWGSAFNPDLSGRIRVSVVATGIEQGAEGIDASSGTMSLAAARAPKRPVLELPAEDEADFEDEFEEEDESFVPAPAPEPVAFDEAEEDEEEGEDDDVDGIVDPLAGMRSDAEDEDEEDWGEEADSSGSVTSEEEDGWEDDDEPAPVPKKEMLDLSSASVDGDTGGDELLLDADRLAEEDEPVQGGAAPRRKGLVSGGSGGSGGTSGGAGSTLFERMANLSRGSSSDDDEEDDDGGDGASSVSIPRFLGRQNNQ
ncbi:MAG: cell division protein FtsZ, partial [Sphingomonadaceae bacterium]|nr:cell division protein FtsZ [Sphingomonadaceae bacterium]